MNKQEKLIVSLTSVISTLEKQGCAGIFKTVELKDGTKEKIECIDEIKKYIDTNLLCKPYKFEDLEEGMWVWDDKDKKCNKIIGISENNEVAVYYITQSTSRYIVKFEENRFFPVTISIQYQNNK